MTARYPEGYTMHMHTKLQSFARAQPDAWAFCQILQSDLRPELRASVWRCILPCFSRSTGGVPLRVTVSEDTAHAAISRYCLEAKEMQQICRDMTSSLRQLHRLSLEAQERRRSVLRMAFMCEFEAQDWRATYLKLTAATVFTALIELEYWEMDRQLFTTLT